MARSSRLVSCAALLALLAPPLAAATDPAASPEASASRAVQTASGDSLTTYLLPGTTVETSPALVLYLQDLDCAPVLDQLPPPVRALAATLAVVVSEAHGFGGATQDPRLCQQHAGKPERLADARRVLAAWLEGRPETLPVVLIGHGAGGDVAAALAASEPRVSALVLLATGGGWNEPQWLRHVFDQQGQNFAFTSTTQRNETLDNLLKHPEGLQKLVPDRPPGWSSFVWNPPVADLERLQIPILSLHGERDKAVPVAAARALVTHFQRRGKANLSYHEYRDLDHHFTDAEGHDQWSQPGRDLFDWLVERGWLSAEQRD